ncbi:MAG: glycosyltransferase [Bacteroides sp.]|nr:glycosyltransferase [Bacteroides sp.]
MKHILFIIHSLHIGGAEKVLCDFLDKFDYSKYRVDLLLYTQAGPLLTNINKNVNVLYIYKEKETLITRFKRKFFSILRSRNWFERRIIESKICTRYDAIISFCQGLAHKLHTLILDRSNNNISWVHSDLSVSNWGLRYFHGDIREQEAAYNAMDKIVFVSKDAKTAFNLVFKIDGKVQQHIVYNFVNKDSVLSKSEELLSINKKKFTFINIGRMIEAKRQDRLIEASKILKEKGYDFEIWIIGDGPLRQELEQKSKIVGTTDIVIFHGMQKNPYPFLKLVDCFVLSSQQEGFSIVIGESFALSKPVISTNVTGPTEILSDSIYGIVVEQDVQQLANAMEQVMTNELMRTHYAEMGLQRLEYFSPEKIMQQIYSLCQA